VEQWFASAGQADAAQVVRQRLFEHLLRSWPPQHGPAMEVVAVAEEARGVASVYPIDFKVKRPSKGLPTSDAGENDLAIF